MVFAISSHLSSAMSLAVAGAVSVAVIILGASRRRRKKHILEKRIQRHELRALAKDKVPLQLRSEFFFDFEAHPFDHADLVTSAHDVIDVLGSIHTYILRWLEAHSKARRDNQNIVGCDGLASAKIVGELPPIFVEGLDHDSIFLPSILLGFAGDASTKGTDAIGLHVCRGAQILGGTFDLRSGGIWLGEGVIIDPGVHITGPAVIGQGTTLRPGAFIRGDVIVGDRAVLRGELKNSIIMNEAELAHPGYAGDSVVGWKGHFGCQSLTANLGLFGAELSLTLHLDGSELQRFSLGRRKVGVILGDCSQLGCNTVTDPGTLVGPRTHIYPLTRLASGVYGPDEIVKNQPDKAGAIVRVPLYPKKAQ